MTFRNWLKRERLRAGLSQEELGVRAGFGRTYINKIERGKVDLPTYETRQKIHGVLGTTEDELKALGIVRDASLRAGPATAEARAHGSFFVPDERPNYGDPLAALVASFSDEQREMFRLFLARDARSTRAEGDRFDAEDAEDAETEQDAG